MHILFKEFSDEHEITVFETAELFGEKGSFRVLKFSNNAIQGAIDLNKPKRIVFEYPRAIIHLMEFNDPLFEDVFVIGHGIGTIASYFSEKRFKIAELNNKIVELSKMCFGYSLKNVIIGDGREILSNEAPGAYEFIVLDAFTSQGTPLHLTSQEFFRMAKTKLDSQGSLILNLIGRGENDRLINAIHTTLNKVFTYTKSFHLPADNSNDIRNVILIGRDKPIGYQTRYMAGFVESEFRLGHIIEDSSEIV